SAAAAPGDARTELHQHPHMHLHEFLAQPTGNAADDDGCNPTDLVLFHGWLPPCPTPELSNRQYDCVGGGAKGGPSPARPAVPDQDPKTALNSNMSPTSRLSSSADPSRLPFILRHECPD